MPPKVSERPWSDYSEADYSIEQWHAACLLHQHDGAPTSKGQCKLPVRTPNGTLNRNGVHAAAAALAGARGGVKAPPDLITKAKHKLIGLYKMMDEEAPDSMMQTEDLISYVLKHAQPNLEGNTTACIVALPNAMESIRLVGDVDKHATLLYFGETSTLPSDAKEILRETLQNVSRIFPPFSERVVEVARLGSDIPPALVATMGGQSLSTIRDALLINPKIGDYLSNGTQYPSYTPHITLDYPDYQGETPLREMAKKLFRVRFDRLALWWNDEHIEFSLLFDEPNAEVSEMAQSGLAKEFASTLSHAKQETVQDVYNLMSPEQKDVAALIIGCAVEDIELPEDEHTANVYNSLSSIQKDAIGKHLKDTQKSGNEHVQKVLNRNGGINKKLLHSDIMSAEFPVETFLAHFGVKGMRWGVIRSDIALGRLNRKQAKLSKAQAAIDAKQAELDKKGGKTGSVRIGPKDTKGEEVDMHVSVDAERFIRTQMKSGVQMSDREIKEAVNRANMVKQYNDIFKKDPNTELRQKVELLELQKRAAIATAKPSKTEKLGKFIELSSKGFKAYSNLNHASGGALNKKMKLEFGQDSASKMARYNRSRELSLEQAIKNISTDRHLSKQSRRLMSESAKRVSSSKALSAEVDALLKYAGDGSVQEKLF